jgi:GxxExxY protein
MTLSPRTEEIATEIVDAAFSVHSALGPGLLESVYEECLAYELSERKLSYVRQLILPINYKGHQIDTGLRLDLLVEDRIVLEIKAVEALVSVHTSQLLTYMKLGGYRLGLILNFNVSLIKNGIHRYVL